MDKSLPSLCSQNADRLLEMAGIKVGCSEAEAESGGALGDKQSPWGPVDELQALLLWTLPAPQVTALREIVDTWDESSGSFLPVSDRRPGPKGEPGERGPPGKEVRYRGLPSGYVLPRVEDGGRRVYS